ncbi:MAG: response regulator [Alphaproteobacteria bacterium]
MIKRKDKKLARLLLIDDCENFRFVARMMLEEAGHEVLETKNGADALSLLQEQSIDIVFTDLFMPGKDGFATIKEICKIQPQQKIVAVTGGGLGWGENWQEYLSREFGFDAVLLKPFEWGDMLRMVDILTKNNIRPSHPALQIGCND